MNVNTFQPSADLVQLQQAIASLRIKLAEHPVYAHVRQPSDLRTFMSAHVFAVWDFMSLLKSLQRGLTCIDLPWIPSRHADSGRFINEIVLGEESDVYKGRAASHFSVYLEAMQEIGADTHSIQALLSTISTGGNWKAALHLAPQHAKTFVQATFDVIENGSLAAQAAAFTFGREDVIPDMFRTMVRDLGRDVRTDTFIWYLERHIEVDGDEHGPLSLKMIEDLCGASTELWSEATKAAEAALNARLALWDGVLRHLTE